MRMVEQEEKVIEPHEESTEMVNLGTKENRKEIKVGTAMEDKERKKLIQLLFDYADVFAWTYRDMPGLSTDIVEHRLPVKSECPPVKQKLRRMKPEMSLKIDLDKATQNQLARGQRLRELLKQSQSAPLTVEEQIITIYTGTNGYLDSLEIQQVRKFLVELRAYLKTNKPKFNEIISSTKTFTTEAEALLKEAIQEQMELFLLQEQG